MCRILILYRHIGIVGRLVSKTMPLRSFSNAYVMVPSALYILLASVVILEHKARSIVVVVVACRDLCHALMPIAVDPATHFDIDSKGKLLEPAAHLRRSSSAYVGKDKMPRLSAK